VIRDRWSGFGLKKFRAYWDSYGTAGHPDYRDPGQRLAIQLEPQVLSQYTVLVPYFPSYQSLSYPTLGLDFNLPEKSSAGFASVYPEHDV